MSSQSLNKTQQRAALNPEQSKGYGRKRRKEGRKEGKGKGRGRKGEEKRAERIQERHDRFRRVMYKKTWGIPHATWGRFATSLTVNAELTFIQNLAMLVTVR